MNEAEDLLALAEDGSPEDWDCEVHGHIWVMGQPKCLYCDELEPEPEYWDNECPYDEGYDWLGGEDSVRPLV